MPNYRIIVQETKSYFVEADNEELAMDNADIDHVQSHTIDRCEIEEVINVGSIIERFGTKDE